MRSMVIVALVLLCGAAWAETYQAHCRETGAVIVARADKPRLVRIRHLSPTETEVEICETAEGPACVPTAGVKLRVGDPPFEIKTAKPLSCVEMGPKGKEAVVGVIIEEP